MQLTQHILAPRSTRTIACAVGVCVVSPVCVAQVQTPRTVPEGVGDISPLDSPLEVDLSVDLRAPDDWSRVFRGMRTDRFGRQRPFLARRSGAMTAVFDQSEYVRFEHDDQQYVAAPAPAGTTYYMGNLPAEYSIDTSGTWLGWITPKKPGELDESILSNKPGPVDKRIESISAQPIQRMVPRESHELSNYNNNEESAGVLPEESVAAVPPSMQDVPNAPSMADSRYRTYRLNQLIDNALDVELQRSERQ